MNFKTERRKGAAMLETALVLVAVLSAIVFVMDMGRMLLLEQFFAERARAGVRNAVVNNWDSTAVANYVCYGDPASTQTGTGFLGLTPAQVSYTQLTDSGVNDARAQVTISGIRMFAFIPGMSGTYTAAPVVATQPEQSQGATN